MEFLEVYVCVLTRFKMRTEPYRGFTIIISSWMAMNTCTTVALHGHLQLSELERR